MQYFISFLEGIITFISPCLLPMLPIYVSYFAGGGERSTKTSRQICEAHRRDLRSERERDHDRVNLGKRLLGERREARNSGEAAYPFL